MKGFLDEEFNNASGTMSDMLKTYLTRYNDGFSALFSTSVSGFANEISNEGKYPLKTLYFIKKGLSNIYVNTTDYTTFPSTFTSLRGDRIRPFLKSRARIVDTQINKLESKIISKNEREKTRTNLFNDLFNQFPWVSESINANKLKDVPYSDLENAISMIEEYLNYEVNSSDIKTYEGKLKMIKTILSNREKPLDEQEEIIQEEGFDLKSKAIQYKWYIIGGVVLISGLVLFSRKR